MRISSCHTRRPVFLLSQAVKIEPNGPDGHYHPELQINVVSKDDPAPLVTAGPRVPTHSKTNARPGDDDPDPGQPRCY